MAAPLRPPISLLHLINHSLPAPSSFFLFIFCVSHYHPDSVTYFFSLPSSRSFVSSFTLWLLSSSQFFCLLSIPRSLIFCLLSYFFVQPTLFKFLTSSDFSPIFFFSLLYSFYLFFSILFFSPPFFPSFFFSSSPPLLLNLSFSAVVQGVSATGMSPLTSPSIPHIPTPSLA